MATKFLVQYDELKHELDNSWLLVIDGRELWIGKSVGRLDEDDKTILLPEWLVNNEGLEDYVIDDEGEIKVW